jgi:sugar phosphate isomerase/epimerase
LVFGCPNNRKILNDNLLKNEEMFVEFFRKLGEYCENKNVKICVENVSSFYKCNYLNSISDCASIVKKINNPNIKTMIDIGNALMEKDEWYDLCDRESDLYNIDVSNKFLKPLSLNENDNIHKLFNFMLNIIDYKYTINLEMILENDENELNNLCESLRKFIHCYGK